MQRLAPTDLPMFMSVHSAHVFSKGSVLVGDVYRYGSLLDITKKQLLSMYFAVLVMYAVERLHDKGIIHADIKPDNFLLNAGKLENLVSSGLVLLDFGQSIDLQLFQRGTRFRGSSKTHSFCCPEMLQNQPWTIQVGLSKTKFCILFFFLFKKNENNHNAREKRFFHEAISVPSTKLGTSVPTLRRTRNQHLSNLKSELSNLSPSSRPP
uniref:Protein kinase domain-containing protein n=1 Tax=Eptatretus burgeri TaxID=7764 RepID=A0A8C4PZR4_EPTBU